MEWTWEIGTDGSHSSVIFREGREVDIEQGTVAWL